MWSCGYVLFLLEMVLWSRARFARAQLRPGEYVKAKQSKAKKEKKEQGKRRAPPTANAHTTTTTEVLQKKINTLPEDQDKHDLQDKKKPTHIAAAHSTTRHSTITNSPPAFSHLSTPANTAALLGHHMGSAGMMGMGENDTHKHIGTWVCSSINVSWISPPSSACHRGDPGITQETTLVDLI